jgi:DNA mismatch repair protein MSH6
MVRALGGALWHLRRSLIDYEILSMGQFYGYAPPDDAAQSLGAGITMEGKHDDSARDEPHETGACLVLDGITMANLELLRNTYDGSERGSLWSFINR